MCELTNSLCSIKKLYEQKRVAVAVIKFNLMYVGYFLGEIR